jgi:hypothetical protein
MTVEEWTRRDAEYINTALKRGMDPRDVSRTCWWCHDTSQCDLRCSRVFEQVSQ